MNNKAPIKNIILASGSPRRQQFLKDLGIPFEIRLKEIDEVYPLDLQHHEISDYLALLKAKSFENELTAHDVLLTSDTIVWHKQNALGKPKNRLDAITMLESLSGEVHEVITSVCIKTSTEEEVFHVVTNVYFNQLTRDEISFYVDTCKPYDKAGSYGIQEWIGLIGIERIEGSYANVVGLPVDIVYQKLKKYV